MAQLSYKKCTLSDYEMIKKKLFCVIHCFVNLAIIGDIFIATISSI